MQKIQREAHDDSDIYAKIPDILHLQVLKYFKGN